MTVGQYCRRIAKSFADDATKGQRWVQRVRHGRFDAVREGERPRSAAHSGRQGLAPRAGLSARGAAGFWVGLPRYGTVRSWSNIDGAAMAWICQCGDVNDWSGSWASECASPIPQGATV